MHSSQHSRSNVIPDLLVADRMLAAGRTLNKDPDWAFLLNQDRKKTDEQVKPWTDRLLASKVLPLAKIEELREHFGLSEVSNMLCWLAHAPAFCTEVTTRVWPPG